MSVLNRLYKNISRLICFFCCFANFAYSYFNKICTEQESREMAEYFGFSMDNSGLLGMNRPRTPFVTIRKEKQWR